MSLCGAISEYRQLVKNLKDKNYNNSFEKDATVRQAEEYKVILKEKLEEGYERQKKVQLILRGIGFTTSNKAIFRVERNKVIKSWGQLKGYDSHMVRDSEGIAANPELSEFNTVLYGDKSAYKAVRKYYERYNLKQYGKGSNKTRLVSDLLYTVSPKFFYIPGTNRYDFELIEKWADVTMEYLKKEYGSDLVWVKLDLDESSPHLHVLVVGREWHSKWQKEVVSHSKHFGGGDKLTRLQDNYANALQRNGFLVQRGMRGSKATHKSVEKWKAEQLERDKRLREHENTIKSIFSLKEKEKEEEVEKERLQKQARNKVLRDVCKDYNINPEIISKAIEEAVKELEETKKKYKEYKNKDAN